MKNVIIVARSNNNAIGKDNDIPWKLSGDFRHFKATTMGGTLIMGRKTYESIGAPLSGRETVIITRDINYKTKTYPNLHIANSIEEAIKISEKLGNDIFWSGGQNIYQEGLRYATEAWVTNVDCEIKEANAFSPKFEEDSWKLISEDFFIKDDKNQFDYTITHLKKH